ncbi:MFS transporter [Catenovulum sp. SM1970]|uniref:MFS transporter n=1 Tax=Marinifaba aquimaris TaxID=2741323 RepID=UPI001573CEFA|nr:MFS transporter [Marinifaba aquimaris]NTS76269.1 MFS transporter [Marinifaba aquimaris]
MESDISFARVKQFPLLMWILLFGSFITRGSYYMVWPFLAVILYEKFALSATHIGFILSAAAIVSVIISFVGSALSDKLGRRPMMYATGILYIVAFSLLAEAETVWGFSIVITLCSIATSLWRPLTSALIGDILPQAQSRELAMQAMYFAVNVGCAIGPMAGVWLGLTGEQSSFYITTVAFAVLLVMLFIGFVKHDKTQTEQTQFDPESTSAASSEVGLKQTISVLAQDKLLQVLILANVLCLFIYGQMDSSLVQYLTREQVPHLLELISSMILTNALIIISFQFLLLKLMANRPIEVRIRIGLVLLGLSQLGFAFNPLDWFWGFIAIVIVMSLAEAITFPTMNVHIDRIAPKHLRGAYFGAATFYDFGFALAPIGGGLILDYFSGTGLFIGCAVLSLLVLYLYSLVDSLSRPELAKSQ